uniref:Uncharacterized protein n=1 Tax=Angiostrongylus cantonensis TaxID=6313 RepID=A0A0K0CX16_ANGCA
MREQINDEEKEQQRAPSHGQNQMAVLKGVARSEQVAWVAWSRHGSQGLAHKQCVVPGIISGGESDGYSCHGCRHARWLRWDINVGHSAPSEHKE